MPRTGRSSTITLPPSNTPRDINNEIKKLFADGNHLDEWEKALSRLLMYWLRRDIASVYHNNRQVAHQRVSQLSSLFQAAIDENTFEGVYGNRLTRLRVEFAVAITDGGELNGLPLSPAMRRLAREQLQLPYRLVEILLPILVDNETSHLKNPSNLPATLRQLLDEFVPEAPISARIPSSHSSNSSGQSVELPQQVNQGHLFT
jgi:hypothetical protein